jgi:hypothetical protein
MDNIGLMELFDEFITFLINDNVLTPVIYQASSLAVSLVTQGGELLRLDTLGIACIKQRKW